MQSLWNDQAVLIDADHVSLLSPTAVIEDRLRYGHGGAPAEAVAALLNACAVVRPRARNRVHVWLGYPWAQCALLPWQPGLPGGDSHWAGYAMALLRERGVTMQMRVRLGPARHGHARLGVAADAALLQALEDKLAEHKWTMATCSDLLSASLQRYHRLARTEGACLVLAEAGAVTCLWPSAHGWEDMITLQLAAGQSHADAVACAQALCNRPVVPECAWTSTLSAADLALPAEARWLGFPHASLGGRSCPA
ncbi:hypothetical protein [Achromobacter piechaudii]|uniref:Uncharacterized protein n=1 Tax=Achromobacter piechaudii TaxID=72556 RepID=A0ABN7F196_9BURK|nr:hypothetical protein [Achromobacter piechaudii]CAB3713348.1 hypothetical protein LMG1873_03330 [Achromobacter piechaudii]CAB3879816.1 hypothetical protein LMG2828_03414 [Achromobacter piechaudii]